MRETRSSGSVEGVVGNHDSYSDFLPPLLAGHKRGERWPARQTKGCPFLEGPDNGGAKTRRAAPAEAEARRVASAQARFSARHAREERWQK
jgi:hypothetical protein